MQGVRIAMWSGPRNLSTALMRAWECRDDCQVWDEPLYPWWLDRTGTMHPGREHVLSAHEADLDLQSVAGRLSEAAAPITYQKHMVHHLLPEVPRGWMDGARHAFLIRQPAVVLASLAAKVPNAGLEDTGLPQQVALLRWMSAQGYPAPPVIDADDVLAAPEDMMRALCMALGVPPADTMCHWRAGPRASDGAWAAWWYDSVLATTGFGPPRTVAARVPQRQRSLLPECQALYEELAALRVQPERR